MIGSQDIREIIDEYDQLKLRIGMTASHSALDICDGAIEEGISDRCILSKRSGKNLLSILQNTS
ncbi:MAG: hypothetical protein Ct9H90mP16_21320 [Candidatus Poseidoniales archaeon]|nr:MAG: hypothetical protein Ct9H90mP16_21320 [Candidatus Poseidoniales archaeon]